MVATPYAVDRAREAVLGEIVAVLSDDRASIVFLEKLHRNLRRLFPEVPLRFLPAEVPEDDHPGMTPHDAAIARGAVRWNRGRAHSGE